MSSGDEDLYACGVCIDDVRTSAGEDSDGRVRRAMQCRLGAALQVTACLANITVTSGPIWQCPEGHVLCASCYEKIGGPSRPCPTCATPLSSIRSRVLERLRDKQMQMHASRCRPAVGIPAHGDAEPAGSTAGPAPSALVEAAGAPMLASFPPPDAALEVSMQIARNIAAVAAAVAAATGETASSEEEEEEEATAQAEGDDCAENRLRAREICDDAHLAQLVRSCKHLFVMFHSMSKDCRRFMRKWEALHESYANSSTVLIAKFSCGGDSACASRTYNLKRFPTLRWYRPGSLHGQELEAGIRADLASLQQWVYACTGEEQDSRQARALRHAPPPRVPGLRLGGLGHIDAISRPACSSERARRGALSRRALLRSNACRHGDADVRGAILKARLGKRSALRAVLAADPSLLLRAQDAAGRSCVCVCVLFLKLDWGVLGAYGV